VSADRELPAAVLERCADAVMRSQGYSEDDIDFYGDRPSISSVRQAALGTAATVLAEILAILEERGLRIVPTQQTPGMEAACDDLVAPGWEFNVDIGDKAPEFWALMLEAAPPIAELLEDREHE
jgi:hypothetical protein